MVELHLMTWYTNILYIYVYMLYLYGYHVILTAQSRDRELSCYFNCNDLSESELSQIKTLEYFLNVISHDLDAKRYLWPLVSPDDCDLTTETCRGGIITKINTYIQCVHLLVCLDSIEICTVYNIYIYIYIYIYTYTHIKKNNTLLQCYKIFSPFHDVITELNCNRKRLGVQWVTSSVISHGV
jgi:hypothetical protein